MNDERKRKAAPGSRCRRFGLFFSFTALGCRIAARVFVRCVHIRLRRFMIALHAVLIGVFPFLFRMFRQGRTSFWGSLYVLTI